MFHAPTSLATAAVCVSTCGARYRPITVKEVASFFGDILQGKIVIEEMSGQMSFDEVRRVMASQ